jgi:hypothetical protein
VCLPPAPSGAHKSVYKNLLAADIWAPGTMDAKTLKLANTRVLKRRERAAGASGGGAAKKGSAAGGAAAAGGGLPAPGTLAPQP